MREQATDPRPTLPMLFESKRALHHIPRLTEETFVLSLVAQCLAMQSFQSGL